MDVFCEGEKIRILGAWYKTGNCTAMWLLRGVCWLHRPGATDYRGWKIPWSRAAAQRSVQADEAAISKATGRDGRIGSRLSGAAAAAMVLVVFAFVFAKISVEEVPRIVWVEPTAFARKCATYARALIMDAHRLLQSGFDSVSLFCHPVVCFVCISVRVSEQLPPLGRKYNTETIGHHRLCNETGNDDMHRHETCRAILERIYCVDWQANWTCTSCCSAGPKAVISSQRNTTAAAKTPANCSLHAAASLS